MNTQLVNLQFSDTYLMVNFEITFQEIQSWLSMAGHNMDDASLFRALLFPESLDSDQQTELCWIILHRYEDVFFQTNRNWTDPEHPASTYNVHQLLLRMMNSRTLNGEDNTKLDLYLLLQQDRQADTPLYPTLHHLFDVKWGNSASA
jgi:hypothetical protein